MFLLRGIAASSPNNNGVRTIFLYFDVSRQLILLCWVENPAHGSKMGYANPLKGQKLHEQRSQS